MPCHFYGLGTGKYSMSVGILHLNIINVMPNSTRDPGFLLMVINTLENSLDC